MKTAFLLLFFALTALAQPNRHEAIVVRLTADLMARNINQFAADLNGFYRLKGPVTRSLATALNNALADKDLSGENLPPLIDGLLAGFDAAFVSREDSSDPLKSAQFRASIEQSYSALTKLGVSVPETQAVLRQVYRAANRIARPTIRQIPPG
jgi:AcrR family transcriptional regulator